MESPSLIEVVGGRHRVIYDFCRGNRHLQDFKLRWCLWDYDGTVSSQEDQTISRNLGGSSETASVLSSEETDAAPPNTVATDSFPEPSSTESEFKAMAADDSVFTFGDEEDYESA